MGEELNKTQQRLKERFIQDRGYWSAEVWEPILKLDPDFFQAYLKFSAVPWKKGVLSPKTKELIYIAIDASTTHLFEPGIRQHVANALKYGATREEIMEVFELISGLGIQSCTMGMPILEEEVKKIADDVRE